MDTIEVVVTDAKGELYTFTFQENWKDDVDKAKRFLDAVKNHTLRAEGVKVTEQRENWP